MFIGSKIQFSESKSQLCYLYKHLPSRCLSVQRYNFLKANHNINCTNAAQSKVVYRFKDTIFWKQITTGNITDNWLLCCLSVQRYNFLKANHNSLHTVIIHRTVVYRFKDTIFWKQITTILSFIKSGKVLFIGSKIQFSESKSQQRATIEGLNICCLSVQRYNFLKANHNTFFQAFT